LSDLANLGRIKRNPKTTRLLAFVRVLLPLGWAMAGIGYYGPWIAHPTAALTLSGVDMGEFVKFLPEVLNGSLRVARHVFYLPPFAVVVGIALLVGSRRLRYSWPLRLSILVLAVPVSLQLLPPAWSPDSLMTVEFRLQALALGACWLLLAGSWPLGNLPLRLVGSLASVLALVAGSLSAWEFWSVKPAIDQMYRLSPSIGWGFFLCLAGLVIVTGAGLTPLIDSLSQRRRLWPPE
jgi:hypothetical protein